MLNEAGASLLVVHGEIGVACSGRSDDDDNLWATLLMLLSKVASMGLCG